MDIVNVIGCGESGKMWDGSGYSIGVTDSFKFGHKINDLIIIDSPRRFTEDRLQTITNSKPDQMWTHNPHNWRRWFPDCKILMLEPFHNRIQKKVIYCSRTSPLVAISLAFNKGAKNIILYGVDFKNHKKWNPDYKEYDQEINTYLFFFNKLKEFGVNVYLGADGSGADGSVFDGKIDRWSVLQS